MSGFSVVDRRFSLVVGLVVCAASFGGLSVGVTGGLTFEQMSALRLAGDAEVSPDGSLIAYTLAVPRRPGVDADGPAWSELHVVSFDNGADRTFVGGEVNVSGARFSPDGTLITYLAKRDGDDHTSLWAIPVAGGESRRLIGFESAIDDYRLSPDGARVAFVARQPSIEERKEAEKMGYSQEVFEEDWLPK